MKFGAPNTSAPPKPHASFVAAPTNLVVAAVFAGMKTPPVLPASKWL
jgi:hypothetical protein